MIPRKDKNRPQADKMVLVGEKAEWPFTGEEGRARWFLSPLFSVDEDLLVLL